MIKIGTIYRRTTKEQVKSFCKANKLTVVAFQIPTEGDLFIAKPWGAEVITFDRRFSSITDPRLIVTRDTQ